MHLVLFEQDNGPWLISLKTRITNTEFQVFHFGEITDRKLDECE